jgi:hypothetical protein
MGKVIRVPLLDDLCDWLYGKDYMKKLHEEGIYGEEK